MAASEPGLLWRGSLTLVKAEVGRFDEAEIKTASDICKPAAEPPVSMQSFKARRQLNGIRCETQFLHAP